MTKQRALILRIIRESDQHLTADQIYQLARKELPGMVLATVYNNLNYLADHGEIRKINSFDGSDHFDKSSVPHVHLICDRCGVIRDFPSEGLWEEMEDRIGRSIHYYELAIHYTCPDCERENGI